MREEHVDLIGVIGVAHDYIAADLQGPSVYRSVESCGEHVEISGDSCTDQNNSFEAGFLFRQGCQSQIAIDLQQAGRQGAVESGTDHGDISTDFCAKQINFLES